jgi:hypothetical protein
LLLDRASKGTQDRRNADYGLPSGVATYGVPPDGGERLDCAFDQLRFAGATRADLIVTWLCMRVI